MQQYQLRSQLLRPLGFSVARLELRERGSWFLTTEAVSVIAFLNVSEFTTVEHGTEIGVTAVGLMVDSAEIPL